MHQRKREKRPQCARPDISEQEADNSRYPHPADLQSADAGVKNGQPGGTRGGGRPLLQCSKVGSTAAAGTSPDRPTGVPT